MTLGVLSKWPTDLIKFITIHFSAWLKLKGDLLIGLEGCEEGALIERESFGIGLRWWDLED